MPKLPNIAEIGKPFTAEVAEEERVIARDRVIW
jgi:hypothetical protein